MVKAIGRELELQKAYLAGETISSIYFGGGTPSLLDDDELKLLFLKIKENYTIADDVEITLEANPDDLDKKNLLTFREHGINRLSIGIQTFDEEQLRFLNRAHNAHQAKSCVLQAQEAGFNNISIDLIYAIPSKNDDVWKNDLNMALALNTQHISSYCLTIEPETVFGNWTRKKRMPPVDEEVAARQYEILMETLDENGFEHYEISNFCKPGYVSRHNSNYWKQEKYLGVGPGAHSFNFASRQFNVSNNAIYLRSLEKDALPFTLDPLDNMARANEYLMTSLRTMWGCNLDYLKVKFDVDIKLQHKDYLLKLLNAKLVFLTGNLLTLTDSGKLIADKIIEDLFVG